MEISGKLFQILAPLTGQGKNGPWKKCDFVIDIPGERFPKKICFTAWGELVDQIQGMQMGSDIKVSFDLSAREYNGKWYSDVKAWRVSAQAASTSGANPYNDVPPPQFESQAGATDDLPF